MKKTLSLQCIVWFASAGLLSLLTAPSHAQTSNHFQIDYTREGAWRFNSFQETPYQLNGRVIQRQLISLGKKLNQLSVVNPTNYSQIQGELHGYLQRLEDNSPDYGRTDVYHAVLLRLMQFDEQIKETLVEHRCKSSDKENLAVANYTPQPQEGKQTQVLPYALLFRRQHYRSKLVYIVTSQNVTVLKSGSPYCFVQSGPHQGYMHNGMILHAAP